MASQVLVHYDFGGVGPPLLLLHANGFHGRAYSPMAQTLSRYYRCIALDFPGQGSCPLGNTPITAPAFADCLQLTLQRLGVQGCLCFGHSLGGAIALLLESRRPGTFAAIYAFEPVMTPVDSSGGRAVPYPPSLERAQVDAYRSLPLKARKRRTRFESLEQAKESLGSKPPFSSFDARALDAYLRFGLKPVAVGAQLAPSPVAVVSTASEPGSAGMDDGTGGSGRAGAAADSVASTRSDAISGVSSGSGLTLACDSETEARVFEAFSPPPDVLPAAVRCPVAVAVGRANASVHSTLVGLAERLAAALPSGRLVRFEGLQHLGPMEDPMAVARSVHQFFSDLASSTSGAVAAATEFSEKQPAATMAVAESQLQSSNASSPAAATAVSRQVIRPGTLVAPARSKL